MRHGTLWLGLLAASKSRLTLGRLRWLASLAITLAIATIPEIAFATTEEIPPINITIQYRGRGVFHIFRALEAAARESGLTCSPTMEDYARGKITDVHDKVITRPRQMLCRMEPSGAIQASMLGDGRKGQIQLRVYYEVPRIPASIVKPKIDAVVGNLEEELKADPLIQAIDQMVNVNSYPVTSKIK